MKRLLVNDALNQLGEHTVWNDLQEWFGCEFVGGDYATLAERTDTTGASLIIRNASYFPPIATSVPTISLLQDIAADGPLREQQLAVGKTSRVVYNSAFTESKYSAGTVIPLPVDFEHFCPQDAYALQQALSLPDNCICWIGAQSEIKGYDIFLQIVRQNPDLCFVAVFKDKAPGYGPPNMRTYTKLTHEELVKVIGACRIGLCTSRMESQHLAGIEMGACGLQMVVPPVGCYWKRQDIPGMLIETPSVETFTTGIRATLARPKDAEAIRKYWQREFDKPIIRKQWEDLVDAMEHPDRRDS